MFFANMGGWGWSKLYSLEGHHVASLSTNTKSEDFSRASTGDTKIITYRSSQNCYPRKVFILN